LPKVAADPASWILQSMHFHLLPHALLFRSRTMLLLAKNILEAFKFMLVDDSNAPCKLVTSTRKKAILKKLADTLFLVPLSLC
jgi:hypothetical protein